MTLHKAVHKAPYSPINYKVRRQMVVSNLYKTNKWKTNKSENFMKITYVALFVQVTATLYQGVKDASTAGTTRYVQRSVSFLEW